MNCTDATVSADTRSLIDRFIHGLIPVTSPPAATALRPAQKALRDAAPVSYGYRTGRSGRVAAYIRHVSGLNRPIATQRRADSTAMSGHEQGVGSVLFLDLQLRTWPRASSSTLTAASPDQELWPQERRVRHSSSPVRLPLYVGAGQATLGAIRRDRRERGPAPTQGKPARG